MPPQVGCCDSLQIHHLHHRLHLTTFKSRSGTAFTGILADNFCDGVCKYWPTLGGRTARRTLTWYSVRPDIPSDRPGAGRADHSVRHGQENYHLQGDSSGFTLVTEIDCFVIFLLNFNSKLERKFKKNTSLRNHHHHQPKVTLKYIIIRTLSSSLGLYLAHDVLT